MAKKVTKVVDAPELEDGFVEQEVMGELSGEWVTPEAGLTLRGILERAFLFTSDNGTSAAYAGRGSVVKKDGTPLLDADGAPLEEWLVSEKATFADAMRAMPIGSEVKLVFLSKEPLMVADKKRPGQQKKSGKDIWRVQLSAKKSKGEPARVMLNAASKKMKAKAAEAAEAAGVEDAPF